MNAIEFRDVGVRYPSQHVPTLKEWAVRQLRGTPPPADFWALRGIRLDVARGETVGIVGGNGAGKSTLLRLIAGIITPSQGRVRTRGTVAPLIELGAGFDIELTGRENIYFNGALLGRTRAMIRRHEEEILDFAGLGAAIDAPLRTYSTGMVARLAFAIATRVEADTVLLDEILSVGDATFREKCEERIRSFCEGGSTVVLVSHDLDAVAKLCRSVVWLDAGRVRDAGPADDVIARYARSVGADLLHDSTGGQSKKKRRRAVELHSVSPTSVRAKGSSVELNGIFPAEVRVTIGGRAPLSVERLSSKRLVAQTPVFPPGTLQTVRVSASDESAEMQPALVVDYDDMPRGHLFHSFVERGVRMSILPMDDLAELRPEALVTFAQVASVIARTAIVNPQSAGHAVEMLASVDDRTGPIVRGALARVLVALRGGSSYEPAPASGIFADVPLDHPAAADIEDLYRSGVTSGCGRDPLRFCPEEPVTRGQFIKMVVAALEADREQAE